MGKKKLFSIGQLSIYHIIPFFVPFFHMINSFVQRDIIIKNEEKENNYDSDYK